MYEARKAKRAANGTGPDIVEENRRLSQGERAAQHGMRNLKTIFAPIGSRRCGVS